MSSSPNSTQEAPVGSPVVGEMAALVRAHNWSKSKLGPRETWPASLTMMVDIMLVSGFPMAVRWGPDFVLIYNDGYKPILAEKHPWALGLPFREAWPEVQSRLAPLHQEILAGKNPGIFSNDLPLTIRRRGDWEEARFTVAYSPIPDVTSPTGIGGVLITAVETTERVRTEQKLRESEERFEFALAAGNAVGTWDWDLRTHIVHADARFARLYGVDPARAASGAPIAEFAAAIHPEDNDRITRLVRQSIDTAGDYAAEYRVRHADGTVRWVVARGRATHDADGRWLRFLGVAVDITDRKLTEQALADLNATLEAQIAERTRERDRLWRVSYNLLGVATFDGKLLSINPAWTAVLGWSERELLAMEYTDLRHPDDAAASNAELARMAQGGITREFESRYRHKDGSYRWVSWTGVPEGDVIYIVGRNVSAEKEAEASLRQAEEALRQSQKMEAVGQLTGGLAHDFNNILTGVIGSLDMIHTRIAQGRMGDVDRYTKAAMTSANRAAALTHRLLAFARRQPLDPKPVNVNQLVVSMEDLLRRTIGEKLRLEIVSAGGLWPTYCDPNQLENVLLNLVINARDAMPSGGIITVETANAHLDATYAATLRDVVAGQYICLCVTDTGSGMEPTVVARAFDPFFTTKPLGQGTGLGLSMVYGFVKQSEGHVRIYSEVGQGTTVKLYLPRFRGAMAEDSAGAGATRVHLGEGESVLVVEDDPVVRELVVDILNELGYRALEAADGPAGLKILESGERIDLLITDVGLPGMNGRQLADAARVKRPKLKVLFVTGYAENAVIGNGFLDPGMEMVTKPFAVDTLSTRIRSMIES